MLTERLRARVPSARPVATAYLRGRALRFHKRSQDGSGKCTLIDAPEQTGRIYGVLFDMAPKDLPALDRAEGRGQGYERLPVHPQTEAFSFQAYAYIAQRAYVDDTLVPYDWYLALVRAGAIQHNLPAHYRSAFTTISSRPDPNRDRRARYRSLLTRAGFKDLAPPAPS